MDDFGTVAAGSGITAALVALIYGVSKLMRRSRCQSHTGCCDLDISRAESERTQRGNKQIVELVMTQLKKEKESAQETTTTRTSP